MSKPNDILSFLSKSKVTKPVSQLISSSKKQFPTGSKIDTLFDTWTIRGTHLAYKIPGNPLTLTSPLKIAAFDLDGTLIRTQSGAKFAYGANDWKWFNEFTMPKISDYQEDGYLIVIFTNQGGIVARKHQKSFINFVQRLNNVVQDLDDVFIFVSPKRPSLKNFKERVSTEEEHLKYRKPAIGMWEEFVKVITSVNRDLEIDMVNSFYCGDAAGRPRDFSDSDKIFASNIGLKFYTPEQLFDNRI